MREGFRVGLPIVAACAGLGTTGFATFSLVGQRSSDAATLSSGIAAASWMDSGLCHTPSLVARTSGMIRLALRSAPKCRQRN
jgi:hypothetical protein